jgi:predicted outer membrane repeat protein
LRREIFLLLIFFSAIPSLAAGRTWYVDAQGTGDAPTIQAGIDSAAAGDTVLILPGTYSENLLMKSRIVLTGRGGRDSTSVRPSVTDLPLVKCSGLDSGTVIDGLTLEGAHSSTGHAGIVGHDSWLEITASCFARNFSVDNGGGIALYGGGGTIRDNVFESDTAGNWGGAIYCDGASPRIESNTVEGCVASLGGGICCQYGASPWIGYNTIVGNYADWGGGIFCGYDACPVIRSNIIDSNTARAGGGGVRCQDTERVWVRENIIKFNSAFRGGGLQTHSVAFTNFWLNVFWGNHAGDNGGAVTIQGGYNTKCFSNTFYANSAGGSGSSIHGGAIVRQCIVANSAGPPAVAYYAQVECSDLWGNDADFDSTVTIGPNTFHEDPMFCDTVGGDFRIADCSPCLNHPQCGLVGALGEGCAMAAIPTGSNGSRRSRLLACHPNPSRAPTRLTFTVPRPGNVHLALYDARGRRLAVLVDGWYEAGVFDVSWDGIDRRGCRVRPGVCFCRLRACGEVFTKKIVLLE